MKRESSDMIFIGLQCLFVIMVLYRVNELEITKWYHRHYSNDENRNYKDVAVTWFISFKDIVGDVSIKRNEDMYQDTYSLKDNYQYMGFALGNGENQSKIVNRANVLSRRIYNISRDAIYENIKAKYMFEEHKYDGDKGRSNNIRISTRAECIQSTWGIPYGGDVYMASMLTPSFSFTIYYDWIFDVDSGDWSVISNLRRNVRMDEYCSIAAVRYYGIKSAVRKWSHYTAINEGVGMANYDDDEYVNEYVNEY